MKGEPGGSRWQQEAAGWAVCGRSGVPNRLKGEPGGSRQGQEAAGQVYYVRKRKRCPWGIGWVVGFLEL